MAFRLKSVAYKVVHQRFLRRWERLAKNADKMSLTSLRKYRSRARQLRRSLDRLSYIADNRLALPLIGSNAFPTPLKTDWAYRPELWTSPVTPAGLAAVESRAMIGQEATIFHDCQISELTCRQLRNTREADLAPFGFRMDVFRFDGSFLSLVIDLPPSATQGLRKKHMVRMDVIAELEKPLEIFARLNVKHGPNTEQIVRELPVGTDEVMVEFDLAYTKLNEKRVEKMWVDLIFEGPEMNQIILRDVTFSRRPRAEL
ncbi:DUF6478 family protein [Cochlodiniinecator piscidefendens]|uniref:DUF6478 family protein n=1 Tax=Cochlodiniinecator piscidefendens TaxID=2715756 RepID=UPI00140898FB|nr:DUF6478 family protein [Cochlodiniinecator piscidefendens]